MYLVYLLLVFLISAYIYETYLLSYDVNEYAFIFIMCVLYSLLYFYLINNKK